jgi:hypothetical protein
MSGFAFLLRGVSRNGEVVAGVNVYCRLEKGPQYFLPAWARDIAWHADTSLDIIIKAKI